MDEAPPADEIFTRRLVVSKAYVVVLPSETIYPVELVVIKAPFFPLASNLIAELLVEGLNVLYLCAPSSKV